MLKQRSIIISNTQMSLKEQGNKAFKSQKYKQAIKLYDEYVTQQHPDNKNAFFNMGLCYSKLKQHQKSIEACKSAIQLDPTYEKVYYRLMKEYYQVGNSYEVFINARLYIKNQKDQQSPQLAQAKEYMKLYKSHFINKLNKNKVAKKLEEKDEIFELIKPLQPNLEQNNEYNEQIDKYPSEWIDQWQKGIQTQEAKWVQIEYIIRELDYNTGISLAYFYLNQISDPKRKKEVAEQVKQIKNQMNIEQRVTEDCMDIENSIQIPQSTQPENEALPSQQTKVPQSVFSKKEQAKVEKPVQLKNDNKKTEQVPQKSVQPQKNGEKVNKIQQLLQKKSQNKKIFEQSLEDKSQTLPQPPKPVLPKEVKPQKKETKIQQKQVKIQQKQVKPVQKQQGKVPQKLPVASASVQKSQQEIEQLYKNYCGSLEKTKDIFAEVYKSIFTILKGKQASINKGKLLILIKKRVKKFKLIVASFSDNEQKAVFDMLSKDNMEEYAVDFAPKYHKV